MVSAVPAEQQWLVTDLQTQLVNSVNPQGPPDPSILIALNLARDQNLNVKKQLVQQLKETATKGRMDAWNEKCLSVYAV